MPGEDKLGQRKRKPKVSMVQCFHPECNHYSESHCCKFFAFPDEVTKNALFSKWKLLLIEVGLSLKENDILRIILSRVSPI